MKKKNDVKAAGAQPVKIEFKDIKSVQELAGFKQDVVAELVVGELIGEQDGSISMTGGKGMRLRGNRLKPSQHRAIKNILMEAQPPLVGGEYDFKDVEYQRKVEDNQRRARAVAVYWGFPALRGEAVLEEQKQIFEYVEGLEVEDAVLDLLYQLLMRPNTALASMVNFSSPSSSPKS